MINPQQIRVLVAGGTTSERNEVRQAIEGEEDVAVLSLQPAQSAADVDAHALVLIPEPAAAASVTSVMPLPLKGVPTFVVTRDESGSAKLHGLADLPRALRDILNLQEGSLSAATRDVTTLAEDAEDAELAKRAMRESQRLAAIGRLTAEIAHEINNPLESVGNLVYLAIREAGMPARAVDYLRSAERELQRIVQISKQTLSFSRESSEPVMVRVTELMDEVVGLYSRRIGQKKLAVIREYAATESIPGLPGELRQVFSNLVTNAIEATSPGGTLRLRIRTTFRHCHASLQSGLRITVGDTGAGIPESARHRLGQMFFSTKGESGTGLGLWVTKSVIARYGGTLQLRSSTGSNHGTVFSIFLPFPHVADLPDDGASEHTTSGNVTEISRHPSFTNSSQRGAESAQTFRKRNG